MRYAHAIIFVAGYIVPTTQKFHPIVNMNTTKFQGTRTNARASHTKLCTRKCPNFPIKLAYTHMQKIPSSEISTLK